MTFKDTATSTKVLWLVVVLLAAALLPALFVPQIYCRLVAAALLAAAAGITLALIKKRNTPSVNHRQVMGLLAVIAVLYRVLLQFSGTFFGFYKNYPALSWESFLRYILPAAVIIVATELIRSVLLSQPGKIIPAVAYGLCIVADLLLDGGLSLVGEFRYFLDSMGLTLFPAVTANLLYHYLARRYGALPVVVYRLLLTLPAYFLPVISAIPDVMSSFVLMLLPLAVWAFIDLLYEKKIKTATERTSKWSYAGLGALLAALATVIMIVSGQFRFGLLVIATPSMTGELNVGDAVLYEEYRGDPVELDDVVVFTKNSDALIVHRVVDIQNVNGEIRYITKGDANEDNDPGYITADDLRGVILCKVPHIGHPSLWLRDLFS